MARLITNLGLQVIGQRASSINGPPAAITTMAVDNDTAATGSFLATHTALSNRAGATTVATQTFSSVVSSAQTVQHVALYATNAANFTIGRISVHNSATPTLSSASLVGGVDQQSFLKTTDASLQLEIDIAYTSA